MYRGGVGGGQLALDQEADRLGREESMGLIAAFVGCFNPAFLGMVGAPDFAGFSGIELAIRDVAVLDP